MSTLSLRHYLAIQQTSATDYAPPWSASKSHSEVVEQLSNCQPPIFLINSLSTSQPLIYDLYNNTLLNASCKKINKISASRNSHFQAGTNNMVKLFCSHAVCKSSSGTSSGLFFDLQILCSHAKLKLQYKQDFVQPIVDIKKTKLFTRYNNNKYPRNNVPQPPTDPVPLAHQRPSLPILPPIQPPDKAGASLPHSTLPTFEDLPPILPYLDQEYVNIQGDLYVPDPIPDISQEFDLPHDLSAAGWNSLLFLSRLIKSNDHLHPSQIHAMQKADPYFKDIILNIGKHKDVKLSADNILFKTITKKQLQPYDVLCLPTCFAHSILMAFYDFKGLHVSYEAMLAHYNSLFFTPNIESHFTASVHSCFKCYMNNSRGIQTFRLNKRSLSNLAVDEYMQIDLVTNLPASLDAGFHSLLLCVDVSSHYIIGRPISDHLQTTICKVLL